MELKDTIPMMTSDDYRERFKAEYYQLVIRIKKLKATVEGKRNFEPTTPLEILEHQLYVMTDYKETLYFRAEFEGIDLPEI